MNWLRKFMIVRYGIDKLGMVLLATSVILSFISNIVNSQLCMIISYVPLVWCGFRMFSKNIYARVNENNRFLNWYTPLESAVKEKTKLLFGTKTHRYYKCKGCGQMIRVPKGRGEIEITCPKCKHKFVTKT